MPTRSQIHKLREQGVDASGYDGTPPKYSAWPPNHLALNTTAVAVATTYDTAAAGIDLFNAPGGGLALVAVTFPVVPRPTVEGTLTIDGTVPLVAGQRYTLAELTNVTFTPRNGFVGKLDLKYKHEDNEPSTSISVLALNITAP